MTKAEAGRELDVKVATEVMEWIWHDWNPDRHKENLEAAGDDYVGPVRRGNKVLASGTYGAEGPPGPFRSPPPHYSTDIAAAWEVIMKFHAEGFEWCVGDDEVYFAKGDPDKPGYQFGCCFPGKETTHLEAICLATLKAVENSSENSADRTKEGS